LSEQTETPSWPQVSDHDFDPTKADASLLELDRWAMLIIQLGG